MSNNGINKDQWVALFEEIGLGESAMKKWHELFEARHPQGHASFLSWLGISEEEISQIRDWSSGNQAR
ncbi:MAG: hypothetical protein HQL50_13330 [Magnetococcales bacterium]|nr:hypothetical protein [Magnetococcales bacterium]